VRILIQTGDAPGFGPRGALLPSLVATAALFWGAGTAEAQTGKILCSLTQNGAPARGTIVVERDGREIAGGSCGSALSVPAGKCKVTVRLDGTLDNPSKSVGIQVRAEKTTPVSVDFQTGVLEVRIETKEQLGTGIVTVNRNGKRIGTLGSGVAATLSAGSYEIVVRLGGKERRYSVDLRPGQRRLVRAQF